METASVKVVKLQTGEIGTVVQKEQKNGTVMVRIITELFLDYKFVHKTESEIQYILQMNANSGIHQCGLFTLTDVNKFKVLFQEPILLPFAPRIHHSNDPLIVSKLQQWWTRINQLSNANKFAQFMNLSHHTKGPLVDAVDTFLSRHKAKLLEPLHVDNEEEELGALRKALLIDAANTFDQGAYELICRINHSCDPNTFISTHSRVISLRYINKQEELTWNFLDDRYLYSCSKTRMQRLFQICGFHCNCFRCKSHFDDARIFHCVTCGKPSIYVTYDVTEKKDGSELDISTKWYDCFECEYALTAQDIECYVAAETEVDDIIHLVMSGAMDKSWKEVVEYLQTYLSDAHFKWFDLWYSIVWQFDSGTETVCGKSLKYYLKHCYNAMKKVYSNNGMNYCRWNIEWKLLNCIANEKRSIIKVTKTETKLINALFDSLDKCKHVFLCEDKTWNEVSKFVESIRHV